MEFHHCTSKIKAMLDFHHIRYLMFLSRLEREFSVPSGSPDGALCQAYKIVQLIATLNWLILFYLCYGYPIETTGTELIILYFIIELCMMKLFSLDFISCTTYIIIVCNCRCTKIYYLVTGSDKE